jgi:LysM repeat protein
MQPPAIVLRLRDIRGCDREFAWPEPKLQIGSHPTSGLVLQGRGVSEYHCALERTRSGYVLRDRGSRAGTFVNSERLTEPRTIHPGDRIYIGEYELELGAPPPTPEPTVIAFVAPPPAPHRSRRRLALAAVLTVGAALLAALWPRAPQPPATATSTAAPAPTPTAVTPPLPPAQPQRAASVRKIRVQHQVVPGETVAEIAERYNVSASQLIRDHDLNPDQPPPPGTLLGFLAVDPPLPKLRLAYTTERDDTWQLLAERFDVGVEQLRRANDHLHGRLHAGDHLKIWVNPQIELRRDEVVRVAFPVPSGARSIGSPGKGQLDGGIQLPPSAHYERVNPRLHFATGHTLKHLQQAIARFRQLYRYKGVLVISDLSQQGGGPLPPHKSHQSGRDVDIWLPALKGTFFPRDLKNDRKPRNEEINWYAAWGLVESLLSTGQIKYIFLDSALHPRLYAAASSMGADPELRAEIQGRPDDDPDLVARTRLRATIRHADGHTGHIHVRFECPPDDDVCTNRDTAEDP